MAEYRILIRRDTAANWASENPVLNQGEPGYEVDTARLKVGDGVTEWASLPYYTSTAGANLDNLIDVDTSGVSAGDVLRFDGADWVAEAHNVESLSDTEILNPADGHILQYNAGLWVNSAPTSSYTDSDVDTHLNFGTATTGQLLSYDGADYDWIDAPSTYGDADVDTHLNFGTATTGQLLSYDGADYDWIDAPSTYGDSDVDTHLNTGTATDGQILSYTGGDYDWIDAPSGGAVEAEPLPTILLKFDTAVDQDDSLNGYTFTTTGTPSLDTGDKQYGASSADFPALSKITTNETINIGTQSWCLEAWLNPHTISGNFHYASKPATGQFLWFNVNNGVPTANWNGAGRAMTSSLSPSTWDHVAWVYNANDTTLKGYFNGVEEFTYTDPANDLGDEVWQFGGSSATTPGFYWWGKIDDLRFTVGDPVYTGDFTPAEHAIPTPTPLGAEETDVKIENPVDGEVLTYNGTEWVNAAIPEPSPDSPTINPTLLVKGDVAVDQDDSLNGYTFATAGTPTLDTGDKKFGASSIHFPETAKITTNETLNFDTEWCIEAWLKPDAVSGVEYWASKPATDNYCWLLMNNGVPGIWYGGTNHYMTSSLSTTEWNHVAFVDDGTNIKGYFNGVEELSIGAGIHLGDFVWAFGGVDPSVIGSIGWYAGKIDDLRVTSGDPVYTGDFTPAEHPIPTPNPLGTDETDVTITSPSNGEVLTYNGTGWVNAAASGGSGGSAADLYDRGWTSTQGQIDTGVDFDLTTEDFWFEVKVFIDDSATYQNLFTLGGDGVSTGGIKGQFLCYKTNSRGITMIHSTTGDNLSGTTMLSNNSAGEHDNQWVTITLQRELGKVACWIDGAQAFDFAPAPFTGDNTGGKIWFWTYADGSITGTGNDECRISDFRFVKSPATLPYLASDLAIEPVLGKPSAGLVNDATGTDGLVIGTGSTNPNGENVLLGSGADGSIRTVSIGHDAGNSGGPDSVSVGNAAGQNQSGGTGTYVGSKSGGGLVGNTSTHVIGLGFESSYDRPGIGSIGLGSGSNWATSGNWSMGIGYQSQRTSAPTKSMVIKTDGPSPFTAASEGDIHIFSNKGEVKYTSAGWEFTADRDGTPQTATINPDTGVYVFPNLPTSDPVNAGQLWNDAGTLKVSAG